MKFSLIMGTVGRTDEVEQFILSLLKQNNSQYELIIVDQNDDNRLSTIVEKYKDKLEIKHIKSKPGLSRARNAGLELVTGTVVAFPDDDCEYPPGLLEGVETKLNTMPEYDGLCGICVDREGEPTIGRFDSERGLITKSNIWQRMTSIGLFLKLNERTRSLRFDVKLGAGSGTLFGAAEDIDYPLTAMNQGAKLFFEPSIKLYHPPALVEYGTAASNRARLYGGGIGRVLTKHNYPISTKLKMLIRPLGGTFISLLSLRLPKASFHWNAFVGRWKGMVS